MNKDKSVLVVGAGLGGLSTALRLASQGYKVEMVEGVEKMDLELNSK